MKRILFIMIPVAIGLGAEGSGSGTRAAALAGAGAMLPGDIWAVVHNPSGLTLSRGTTISAFMIPGQYGLRELRTVAVTAVFPVVGDSAGLCVKHFGFDLYREVRCAIGWGRHIARRLAVGVAVEWMRLAIRGYGTSNSLLCNIGCTINLVEGLEMGVAGKNVLGETIGRKRIPLPQAAAVGLSYQPAPDFLLVLEAEKDVRYVATFKSGVEIRLAECLTLRGGIANHPDKVSAGFSLRHSFVEFGYAAYSHVSLGWTHQVDISVEMGR